MADALTVGVIATTQPRAVFAVPVITISAGAALPTVTGIAI